MKALFMVLPLAVAACDLAYTPFADGIPIAGQGYDGPAPRHVDQDDAELIVWKWTYGGAATVVAPPPVVWRKGDKCHDPETATDYEDAWLCNSSSGNCCNGFFYRYLHKIEVELMSWGEGKISDTVYPHELCHAWLFAQNQDPDSEHHGPCFRGTDGGYQTEGSLVAEAWRRLKIVGL